MKLVLANRVLNFELINSSNGISFESNTSFCEISKTVVYSICFSLGIWQCGRVDSSPGTSEIPYRKSQQPIQMEFCKPHTLIHKAISIHVNLPTQRSLYADRGTHIEDPIQWSCNTGLIVDYRKRLT